MSLENSSGASHSTLFRSLLRVVGPACVAALCVALLFTLRAEPMPFYVPVGLLALAALTFWREQVGLFVVAALIPIASWFGRGWNYSIAWPETLVVAVAAGWFMGSAVRPKREPDDLDAAVQVLCAVVIASLVVYTAVFNWRLVGSPFSLVFARMLRSNFSTRGGAD